MVAAVSTLWCQEDFRLKSIRLGFWRSNSQVKVLWVLEMSGMYGTLIDVGIRVSIPARGMRGNIPQNASGTTSPPFGVDSACHTLSAIESVTNCEWPSPKHKLTPSEWQLRVVMVTWRPPALPKRLSSQGAHETFSQLP